MTGSFLDGISSLIIGSTVLSSFKWPNHAQNHTAEQRPVMCIFYGAVLGGSHPFLAGA